MRKLILLFLFPFLSVPFLFSFPPLIPSLPFLYFILSSSFLLLGDTTLYVALVKSKLLSVYF